MPVAGYGADWACAAAEEPAASNNPWTSWRRDKLPCSNCVTNVLIVCSIERLLRLFYASATVIHRDRRLWHYETGEAGSRAVRPPEASVHSSGPDHRGVPAYGARPGVRRLRDGPDHLPLCARLREAAHSDPRVPDAELSSRGDFLQR